MIDKPKRFEAARLIEEFFEGRITNFEYDNRYPRSPDLAVFAIYSMLWFAYSDVNEHHLDGSCALTDEDRQVVDRCILFLRTENEYVGPKNFVSLSAPFRKVWYWLRSKNPVDPVGAAWPFENAEQLEVARNAASQPPI